MRCGNWIAISSAAMLSMLCGLARPAGSQEIRYFERNGITYREVLGCATVVQAPQTAQCSPLVYRPQFFVESRRVLQSYWVPITEYRWETRWVNRWNPFAEPYQELRYVPVTRWEYRTEIAEMPVTCQRWVAEPAAKATPSYAAVAPPGPSAGAVGGLASTYAPRVAAGGQSTGAWASPMASRRLEAGTTFPASGLAASSPALASRLPTRSPSGLPSAGMVPVEVPSWSGTAGIGGIRRYEDEPPRFGR